MRCSPGEDTTAKIPFVNVPWQWLADGVSANIMRSLPGSRSDDVQFRTSTRYREISAVDRGDKGFEFGNLEPSIAAS